MGGVTHRRSDGFDAPAAPGARWDQPRRLETARVEPRRPRRRSRASTLGRTLLVLVITGAIGTVVVGAVIALRPVRPPTAAAPASTVASAVPPADNPAVEALRDRITGTMEINRRIDQVSFGVNWAVIAMTMLLVGMAVFLLIVYPAGRSERSPLDGHGRLRGLAKLATFVVVVGCVAEVLLRAAISSDRGWSGMFDTRQLLLVLAGPVGVSCLLRSAGAILILAMMLGRFSPVKRPFTIARGGFSLIGGVHVSALASRRLATVLGIAVVLASFLAVGHAQASQPRVLLMASDVTHVLAGSVWFGGVTMLGVMLRQLRRVTRASSPLDPDPDLHRLRRQMATAVGRFSVAAAASIAAVTIAGVALGVSQIMTMDALYKTAYGVTLAAKVVMVGFVMLLGGFNHSIVVPRVLADESDERAWRGLRVTVQIEAFVICFGILLASVALAYGGLANIVK